MVLADSRSRIQSSLSLALALQFLTPKFFASFVTPSIHLRFGLPARLLPSGLHGKLSCIRITFPAHLSLDILIVVTRSTPSYKRYSSSYLDATILVHCILSLIVHFKLVTFNCPLSLVFLKCLLVPRLTLFHQFV